MTDLTPAEPNEVFLSGVLIIGAFLMLGAGLSLFQVVPLMSGLFQIYELYLIGISSVCYMVSILIGADAIAFKRPGLFNAQAWFGLFGLVIQVWGTVALHFIQS